MNEYDVIEELKRRSKEKGIPLSEEDIRRNLERLSKETEGLSIHDRIKKLHKMIQEEE